MFTIGRQRQHLAGPAADSGDKWLKYYCCYHEILLVGEGDFSFSLSLAISFGSASNIVATSLDSYHEVVRKYKNARFNLRILQNYGATVLHGVDATKMKHHFDLNMRKFDRIIFNFPHAGFFRREDNLLMIQMHKRLVYEFFKNASQMLRIDAEIHVNHKTKPPFSDWNIVQLAYQNSLAFIGCADFNIQDYPGYCNKRGQGSRCDDPFFLGQCSTYKFSINHRAKRNTSIDMQRNHLPISCPYPTSFESSYSNRHMTRISMPNHRTPFESDYSPTSFESSYSNRHMTRISTPNHRTPFEPDYSPVTRSINNAHVVGPGVLSRENSRGARKPAHLRISKKRKKRKRKSCHQAPPPVVSLNQTYHTSSLDTAQPQLYATRHPTIGILLSRFITGMPERTSNDVHWSRNLRSNYGEEIQRSDAYTRTRPGLYRHW